MEFRLSRQYDIYTDSYIYRIDGIGETVHMKTAFMSRRGSWPQEVNPFVFYLNNYHKYYNVHTGEGEEGDKIVYNLGHKLNLVIQNREVVDKMLRGNIAVDFIRV